MINREIFTDTLGREGVRWQTADNQHIFIPLDLPDPFDRQIELQDKTGNYSTALLLNKTGTIRISALDLPKPFYVTLEKIPEMPASFRFILYQQFPGTDAPFRVGFSVDQDKIVKPIALKHNGDTINILDIPSFHFSLKPETGDYTVALGAGLNIPLFTVQKLPSEWEFGQHGQMFSANMHTADDDAQQIARLLKNGISTEREAMDIGKYLSWLHRDIYFPAK